MKLSSISMNTINNPFQPSLYTLERPEECYYCKKNLLIGTMVRVYDGKYYCYEHSQNSYTSGNEVPNTYGNFFLTFDDKGFEISFYPEVVLQQQTCASVVSRTPIVMLSNERIFQLEVFHVQDQISDVMYSTQESFFEIEQNNTMIHLKIQQFEQPESNKKIDIDEQQLLNQNAQQFEYQQMSNIAGQSQMQINPRYSIYKTTHQRYGFRYKYLQINLVLSYPPPNCRQFYYQYNVLYVLRADIAKQYLLNQYPKNNYITQEFTYLMFKPNQMQCTRIIEFDNKGNPIFNNISKEYMAYYNNAESNIIREKKAALDLYVTEQKALEQRIKAQIFNQDENNTLQTLLNILQALQTTKSDKLNNLNEFLLGRVNINTNAPTEYNAEQYENQLEKLTEKSPFSIQLAENCNEKELSNEQEVLSPHEMQQTEEMQENDQNSSENSDSDGSLSPIQTGTSASTEERKKQQLTKLFQEQISIPMPVDDFSQQQEENHFSIHLNDNLLIQNRNFNPGKLLVYSYAPIENDKLSSSKRGERQTACFLRNYLVMNDFMQRFVNYQVYSQTVLKNINTIPLIMPEVPVLSKLTIELYSKFQKINQNQRLGWDYYQNFLNFYSVLLDQNGQQIQDYLDGLNRLNQVYKVRPRRMSRTLYSLPTGILTLGLLNMDYYYQLIEKQIKSKKVKDDDTKLFGTDKIFMEPFYLNTFLSARLSFPYFKFSGSNCHQLYINNQTETGFFKGGVGIEGNNGNQQTHTGIELSTQILSNVQGEHYMYKEIDELYEAMNDASTLLDVKQFAGLEQLCQNHSMDEINYLQQQFEHFAATKQTANYFNHNNYTQQTNTSNIQYLGTEADELIPETLGMQKCIQNTNKASFEDVAAIIKNNISLFSQQNLLREAKVEVLDVQEQKGLEQVHKIKQEPQNQNIKQFIDNGPVLTQASKQSTKNQNTQKEVKHIKRQEKIKQEFISTSSESSEYQMQSDESYYVSEYTGI